MAQDPLQHSDYNVHYFPPQNPEHRAIPPILDHYALNINSSAVPRGMESYPNSIYQSLSRDPVSKGIMYGSPQAPLYYDGPQHYQMQAEQAQPIHQQQYQTLPSVSTFISADGYPHGGSSSGGSGAQHSFDTSGQLQPIGMRPRLTTSLSEEEGSVCFQVDVDGICVARREDNHMINGTKLLNVVGMTRGRRDGILKAEKQKQVVKIGPMHLKGVWIPYERALALANQEKITEKLYPLFVHDIGALLYHPSNAARPLPMTPALGHRLGQQGPVINIEASQVERA